MEGNQNNQNFNQEQVNNSNQTQAINQSQKVNTSQVIGSAQANNLNQIQAINPNQQVNMQQTGQPQQVVAEVNNEDNYTVCSKCGSEYYGVDFNNCPKCGRKLSKTKPKSKEKPGTFLTVLSCIGIYCLLAYLASIININNIISLILSVAIIFLIIKYGKDNIIAKIFKYIGAVAGGIICLVLVFFLIALGSCIFLPFAL